MGMIFPKGSKLEVTSPDGYHATLEVLYVITHEIGHSARGDVLGIYVYAPNPFDIGGPHLGCTVKRIA